MWFVCEKEGIAGAASVWTVLISTCVVLNVGAVQNIPPIINLPQAIFGHKHTPLLPHRCTYFRGLQRCTNSTRLSPMVVSFCLR